MSASEARGQREICWDIDTTLNSIVIAEGFERQNRARHKYRYGTFFFITHSVILFY
jgi:hypothetical protein